MNKPIPDPVVSLRKPGAKGPPKIGPKRGWLCMSSPKDRKQQSTPFKARAALERSAQ